MMITNSNWEILKKAQVEFDKLLAEKSSVDLKWFSYSNAERLKLALLVEVGEFANEIKSFKVWRKKSVIDWFKAKEELIDCLSYFLGLVNLYQIEFTDYFYLTSSEDLTEWKEASFNKLLLEFFAKTNDLSIVAAKIENQDFYQSKKIDIEPSSYHHWWSIFSKLCQKLQIDEQELLAIYWRKNKINYQRVEETE